ncbi:MAG: hypothetical protein RIC03_12510 [Cyclobacteriaceae bacterium]
MVNQRNHEFLRRFIPRPSGRGILVYTKPSIKESSGSKKTLREDWPFLADPECPPELQVLVSRKLSAYYTYLKAHQDLFDCTNLNEQFDSVKQLVESFIENQAIYRELNHYKNTGKILGDHEVFDYFKSVRALRKLNQLDLYRKKEKLEHNIWRLETEIKKGKAPHLTIGREKLIEKKKVELGEIQRLLNV